MENIVSFSSSRHRKGDLQTLGQKSHFTKSALQGIKIKNGLFKNGIIRQEGDFGTGLVRIVSADHFQSYMTFPRS